MTQILCIFCKKEYNSKSALNKHYLRDDKCMKLRDTENNYKGNKNEIDEDIDIYECSNEVIGRINDFVLSFIHSASITKEPETEKDKQYSIGNRIKWMSKENQETFKHYISCSNKENLVSKICEFIEIFFRKEIFNKKSAYHTQVSKMIHNIQIQKVMSNVIDNPDFGVNQEDITIYM